MNTSSRPITEVKQHWAQLVLGRETAWELWVLLALLLLLPNFITTFYNPIVALCFRQRPYYVENTSSRPITEVKQRWAQLVLGRKTAWELWVLLASYFYNPGFSISL